MQVLIVDNSIQILDRLAQILSEMECIKSIYKAVSYQEATIFLKKNKPDVVLLDSGLRGNGTINLLKEIKKTGSAAPVIILSSCYDDYIVRECKSYGADFIFDKYHEFEKIPGVIDDIAAK